MLQIKDNKTAIQTVISNKAESRALSWYGVVSEGKVEMQPCEGSFNAKKVH